MELSGTVSSVPMLLIHVFIRNNTTLKLAHYCFSSFAFWGGIFINLSVEIIYKIVRLIFIMLFYDCSQAIHSVSEGIKDN